MLSLHSSDTNCRPGQAKSADSEIDRGSFDNNPSKINAQVATAPRRSPGRPVATRSIDSEEQRARPIQVATERAEPGQSRLRRGRRLRRLGQPELAPGSPSRLGHRFRRRLGPGLGSLSDSKPTPIRSRAPAGCPRRRRPAGKISGRGSGRVAPGRAGPALAPGVRS